jgi:Restriction endonuclease
LAWSKIMAAARRRTHLVIMVAILLFAALGACGLAILLARYGKGRAAPRVALDPRAPLPRATLQTLVSELLEAMGFTLRGAQRAEGCLVGARKDPLGESLYVVVISPASDDSTVDQAEVLAAAETVKAEGGARGMLVAIGEITADGLAGLDVPLELVDRRRLRQLIAEHLPGRLGTLDRYRGFAPAAADEPAPPDLDSDQSTREDRWASEGGSALGTTHPR